MSMGWPFGGFGCTEEWRDGLSRNIADFDMRLYMMGVRVGFDLRYWAVDLPEHEHEVG